LLVGQDAPEHALPGFLNPRVSEGLVDGSVGLGWQGRLERLVGILLSEKLQKDQDKAPALLQ
jgi:hypothetical protein